MRMEVMPFKGEAVGLQIVAENNREKVLLKCLSGLTAVESRGFDMSDGGALFLCPKLPWENVLNTR